MAISQTMSNPNDWIFQNELSHGNQIESPPTNPFAATSSAAASRNNNLSPEQGRVSKPIRRRSRASRRTPTTLLNTDTTNFRAMVQHFTGGPAAPFAARPQIANRGGAALNYMDHMAATNSVGAPGSGFNVQYQNQLQQQHMFMMDNMHGGGGGGGVPPQAPPGSVNRSYDNYML